MFDASKEDKRRACIDRWERMDNRDIGDLSNAIIRRNDELSLKREFIEEIHPDDDDLLRICKERGISAFNPSDEIMEIVECASRMAFSTMPFELFVELKKIEMLLRDMGNTRHFSRGLFAHGDWAA